MLYIERLTQCDELRETLQRYLNYNNGILGHSSNHHHHHHGNNNNGNILIATGTVDTTTTTMISATTSNNITTSSSSSSNTIVTTSESIPVEVRPENLAKIRERSDGYQIDILNYPRPYKHLVILDIDYTILDLGLYEKGLNDGVEADQLAKCARRPYLHQFLGHIYKDYDIGIWSATSMEVLSKKMKLLGVDSDPSYKISFYLDRLAMICIDSPKFGRVRRVKPLGLVWRHFPQYSPQNTIMIDDSEKSFIMNPQSGLKVRKFVQAKYGDSDKTLLHLSGYLKRIANLRDFSLLDHNKWESMVTSTSTSAISRMIPVEVEGTNNDNENDILSDMD